MEWPARFCVWRLLLPFRAIFAAQNLVTLSLARLTRNFGARISVGFFCFSDSPFFSTSASIATTMAPPTLTSGALLTICKGGTVDKPVLQVRTQSSRRLPVATI